MQSRKASKTQGVTDGERIRKQRNIMKEREQ